MKVLGVTGGIGSGKSTVCRVFQTLGIPVYDADSRARRLYTSDAVLRGSVIEAFGEETYTGSQLNRKVLANMVFPDPAALARLNALVHPRVAADFAEWKTAASGPYVIREAAILFESGSHADCDRIVLVSAPEDVRISRVMERDGATEAEVRQRMERQWSDARKRVSCNFELVNDNRSLLTPSIEGIHQVMCGLP